MTSLRKKKLQEKPDDQLFDRWHYSLCDTMAQFSSPITRVPFG